jgi:DNA-binding LytR/AlgR family response regulator
VAVPLYHETRFLEPGAITHLEAQGSYTQVYLEGQTLLTSLPLSSFARALPDAFLRVHRSFLVNVHRVRSLVRRENRLFLRLEGETTAEVPVSRRREARVRAVVDTAQQVLSTTR